MPGVEILLVVLRIYFVVMSLCVVLKVALCFVLKWSQRQHTAITVAKERYRFLSDHPGPHNPYHPDIYN